ncbi:LytTR family transcriptional regulator DNA-binding domain-containing protein [uncultured Polaribacter sp.]|uniref:LytR/AlgR family response regulator transcription factor n=1 Tax=uncultured Polaribacter sp. TaxID=174711 RepID=UPI002637A270|nr:LytTR family transcriptional regulator DNA-binding domain-containing protein [uncultured Polaribacter sp.]
MKKDRLYFLTFIAIAIVFLVVASISVQYFIKASANQLIEVQVESSRREAKEVASLLDYQLAKGVSKEDIVKNIQEIITESSKDGWFLSVFNWSGKEVAHPDITKIGQNVNSNQSLLASLEGKNNSEDLYEIFVNRNVKEKETSEIIHIAPLKKVDLLVAAHVNMNLISEQMNTLKSNFYLIFLIMGILVIGLSFVAVRFIGSRYEKQLELQNSSLTSEVVNLSKLNTDLLSYKDKIIEEEQTEIENTNENEGTEEVLEKEKQRILTYVRNELVPIPIKEIAYIYTENTITYVVCFSGKRSTTNASLDDMYTNLNNTLFFRANRQFIISITAIDKIIKYGNSQLKILLQSKTSEEIIISKNKAAEFKQWLNM